MLDLRLVFIEEDPMNTNRRSSIWYLVELGPIAVPVAWAGLGHLDLQPPADTGIRISGSVLQQFTNVYFDVSLTVDALVQAIRGRRIVGLASRQADEV